MRIMHIVCTDAFAGVERYVAGLAGEQVASGHEVTVIGGHGEAMDRAMPAQVRHLPAGTVVRALRQAYAARPVPHIVNAHLTAAEVAAVLAVGWRVPVVATRHIAARRGGSSQLSAVVTGRSSRRLAGQIAVSRFVAASVEGASRVILSGVAPQPRALGYRERRNVVLVAQRLEPEKRTDVAIEGFLGSAARRRGVHLVVAGDGSERGALAALIQDRGAADVVHFLGHRTDIDELVRHSAAVIGPTPVEGLGLSVLEAMAHGTPVVAAASAGHLETVGTVAGGRMFTPGDTDALGALLDEVVLGEEVCESYSARLQSAQRDRFTLARQAAETEAYYLEILDRQS